MAPPWEKTRGPIEALLDALDLHARQQPAQAYGNLLVAVGGDRLGTRTEYLRAQVPEALDRGTPLNQVIISLVEAEVRRR